MTKNTNNIGVIVQARMGSQRIPGKMLKPFAGTTLVDILLEKLKKSTIIPRNNICVCVHEEELKEATRKHELNIFHRSAQSASSEGKDLTELFEWHKELPFKYVIMVSACNPLLKIETIDSFFETFLNSDKGNLFGVFKKKNYYWDKNKQSITDWKDLTSMNTKFVDPVYEAAHCLYASRMDFVSEGYWMTKDSPPDLDLYEMEELETFDIDYEWQFNVAENLYKEFQATREEF